MYELNNFTDMSEKLKKLIFNIMKIYNGTAKLAVFKRTNHDTLKETI